MGNVLQQARNPHTDYHTGRYIYHPGSFTEQINDVTFRETLNDTGHLTFDLSFENVEDDRIVPKPDYETLLPKIHSLDLKSEPSVPTLYNHTPNVLLYLAPHLIQTNIRDVNLIDLVAIEGIFPLLPDNAHVVLEWDHMRKLSERNHSIFDKVSVLNIHITEHNTVTVDSLVLLHEWASCTTHRRTLVLNVDHWTNAMQTVFTFACEVIQPLSNGLDSFDLFVDRIEHNVFESVDPADVVWCRFLSTKTRVFMILFMPGAALSWLVDMLNVFKEASSHIRPRLVLECEEKDWVNMKQTMDRLLLDYVERTRDAYLSAIGTTAFPTEIPRKVYWPYVHELALTIRLPQTEMGRITYTPPSATDLQTKAEYQDPAKIAVTMQLQTEMFTQRQLSVSLTFDLTRGTKRKHGT